MAALDRIFSLILRAAELAFASIVAGVTGQYLHNAKASASAWALGRWIYTETVAGLSILLALIWLFPFSRTFTHWPIDLLVSILWWAAFGLIVHLIGSRCGAVFDWQNVSPRGDECGKFKADIAFAFLSAILWLVSAIIGLFWTRRHERYNRRSHV
ncbi:hypothetical protein CDD82_3303 [Ophiocordyceps australis]|uniref:MARVEL domain-containing protein n=1 Tax=Ophiocordyceps australis TaxID=1399860 RepID=A0A2C5ZA55_9HYPO|nr:hypothetical protein CDD82_3303 [Ophiocordyceps australis]